MADKRISEFPETFNPALTGFIPVVDVGVNEKVSLITLFDRASAYIGLNTAELNEVSTVVKSGSSNWGIDSDVRSLTGDFDLASKTVFANASNWQDTHIQFQNNSPFWQDTTTVVQSNSASWAIDNSIDTEVRSLTGKYEDVSTVVQTNSASWAIDNSNDTELRGLSANWQDASTAVQTNSAQWASNIDTSVRSLSSEWAGGSAAYTNLTANSAAYLSAVDLSFLSVSGNWNSTYSTVQSNSAAVWNYQGTDLKLLSSNWQDTSTVVQTNSADWNAIKSVPPLHKLTHASGGTDALTPSDIGAIGKNASDLNPVNIIRAISATDYNTLVSDGLIDANTIYFIL